MNFSCQNDTFSIMEIIIQSLRYHVNLFLFIQKSSCSFFTSVNSCSSPIVWKKKKNQNVSWVLHWCHNTAPFYWKWKTYWMSSAPHCQWPQLLVICTIDSNIHCCVTGYVQTEDQYSHKTISKRGLWANDFAKCVWNDWVFI